MGLLIAWLAAGTSILALIAAAAYSMRLQIRIADLETRLAQTLARASVADRAIASANRLAADAHTSVAVLTAPDVQVARLEGQAPGSKAAGRAFWSQTHGLVVVVPDLPPLPDGRPYHVWIGDGRGSRHIGQLSPSGATFVQTAPDLERPGAISVTDEPTGAGASPGASYLQGTFERR